MYRDLCGTRGKEMSEMKSIALEYPGVNGQLALVLWYIDQKLQSGREVQWDSNHTKDIYITIYEDLKDYILTMA
jgi:hypothetical protein